MLTWWKQYKNLYRKCVKEESGQTIIEYVLLVALIALVVFASNPTRVTDAILGVFNSAANKLESVT